MARFKTDGLDDIIAQVVRLGKDSQAVSDKMLLAGAEEVKKAWKAAAIKHNLRDTGDMINSIGYPVGPKDIGGIRTIDIYPQGKDRNGARNAEKAFILHYGTSSAASQKRGRRRALRRGKKYRQPGIPATHWVDDADEMAADPVQEVMEKIFNDYLEGK